ncbi:MAG: hypothetical protein V1743_05185 [Nanoarchaeota archaeon]
MHDLQPQDTWDKMSYPALEYILTQNAFVKDHFHLFSSRPSKTAQVFSVWSEKRRGLLVVAESYTGLKEVNRIDLYYELSMLKDGKELDDQSHQYVMELLRESSHVACLDEQRRCVAKSVRRDCRIDFVDHLQKLEQSGLRTNSPWQFPEYHSLWLVNFAESVVGEFAGYDYKKIIQERIKELPKEVQMMIGWTG